MPWPARRRLRSRRAGALLVDIEDHLSNASQEGRNAARRSDCRSSSEPARAPGRPSRTASLAQTSSAAALHRAGQQRRRARAPLRSCAGLAVHPGAVRPAAHRGLADLAVAAARRRAPRRRRRDAPPAHIDRHRHVAVGGLYAMGLRPVPVRERRTGPVGHCLLPRDHDRGHDVLPRAPALRGAAAGRPRRGADRAGDPRHRRHAVGDRRTRPPRGRHRHDGQFGRLLSRLPPAQPCARGARHAERGQRARGAGRQPDGDRQPAGVLRRSRCGRGARRRLRRRAHRSRRLQAGERSPRPRCRRRAPRAGRRPPAPCAAARCDLRPPRRRRVRLPRPRHKGDRACGAARPRDLRGDRDGADGRRRRSATGQGFARPGDPPRHGRDARATRRARRRRALTTPRPAAAGGR